MKITRLISKNFRTLTDIEISFPFYYGSISGKNNAGKSNIVMIIREFFSDESREFSFGLSKDKFSRYRSKFCADDGEVVIAAEFTLNRVRDSEVFFLIENLSPGRLDGEEICVLIERTFSQSDSTTRCRVNDLELGERESAEVARKLKSAANVFIYNSTSPTKSFHFVGGEFKEMLDVFLTDNDKEKIEKSNNAYRASVGRVVREHREHFSEILGRLREYYEVDIAPSDSLYE